MNDLRKKRLESAGFRVGSVAEFLNLTPSEEKYVNIKASLVMEVFTRRKKCHLTQAELAERVGTSQSRIAKLEAGDPSVSFDLLIRVLIALDTPEHVITKSVMRIASRKGKKAPVELS